MKIETELVKEIMEQMDIEITFNNNESNPNIHIKNSYRIRNNYIKKLILTDIMNSEEYKNANRTRTLKSYLKEWKAHNVLYRWHIQRERTAHVDLDEQGYNWLYGLLAIFE